MIMINDVTPSGLVLNLFEIYTENGHKLRFYKTGFGGLKRTEILPRFVKVG